MLGLLLRHRAGLRPDTDLEVQLAPLHSAHLGAPGAGHEEEPDNVGGDLILVLGERLDR